MGYETIPERLMIKMSKNDGWQSKENVIRIKTFLLQVNYGLVGDDQTAEPPFSSAVV
jgi:hypothetical protein